MTSPPRRSPARRILGLALIGAGVALLALWVGVPLSADSPAPPCQPVEGVLRGAYHLHPNGHDDSTDRSARLVRAGNEACLDFMIVTDHHGARAEAITKARSDDTLLVLDGAEWTRESKHHLGQLVGAHEPLSVSARDAGFRVLNHPAWSRIARPSDLSDEERALLADGQLAVEVHNVTRTLRTPPSRGPFWLALLVGPARQDLFYAALSVPGESLQLWIAVQRAVGRSVPMLCGTDAHGGLTDYADLLGVSVLHVPAPADGSRATRDWVMAQIRAGRVVCVNEDLGSPGVVDFRADGSSGALVRTTLPEDARWAVVRDGERVIAEGRGQATLESLSPGVYHLEVWREVSFGWLGRYERLWALTGAVVLVASR